MKSKSLIVILAYDLLVLAVFAALAYFFSHWWIVLFGILFMCFPKTIPMHCRVCDNCGARSTSAETKELALERALKAGWYHNHSTDTDLCPKCKHDKNAEY